VKSCRSAALYTADLLRGCTARPGREGAPRTRRSRRSVPALVAGVATPGRPCPAALDSDGVCAQERMPVASPLELRRPPGPSAPTIEAPPVNVSHHALFPPSLSPLARPPTSGIASVAARVGGEVEGVRAPDCRKRACGGRVSGPTDPAPGVAWQRWGANRPRRPETKPPEPQVSIKDIAPLAVTPTHSARDR